ncbi:MULTISPECIES: hypothetical protein [Streptomyces]|uniref:hypothetical protein n=1 Tax=Streptomyces TaxID=1883 RepID=UPI0015864CFF|nr:hypothetical protein [Streptomyces hawaiiensis]
MNSTTSSCRPTGAGLRISTTDGSAETWQLRVTAAPADGDQVLSIEGTRLFLADQAATLLNDKILDTGMDAGGESAFVIAEQEQGISGM